MVYRSYVEIIISKLMALSDNIATYLSENFSVIPANKPYDTIILISPKGDQFYQKLDQKGEAARQKLVQEYDKIAQPIRGIIATAVDTNKQKINDALERIKSLAILEGTTWHKTPQEACEELKKQGEIIKNTLKAIFPDTHEDPIIVPDTNALYALDDFQKWTFRYLKSFSIYIIPTVLKELDEHKVYHRNNIIIDKAKKIIRRLKELGKRGSLNEGVNVVKGKIKLFSISIEPDFTKTIRWLDPDNPDDRIVSSVFEIIQEKAGQPVIILTGDINLQNKCKMLNIPFVDPEDL